MHTIEKAKRFPQFPSCLFVKNNSCFAEQLMDKMRDCPIEDENKINIVEITDQIVRYLSEEEFHMFRFCLGLQINHPVPPKLQEHTRLFSRLLLVSARRIIAKEMDELEVRQSFSKKKYFSTGLV